MYSRQIPHLLSKLAAPARNVAGTRTLSSTASRFNAEPKSAYRQGMANYWAFARPFGKVFLGAVLTYQIIYWSWLKLETDETKFEKNAKANLPLEQVANLEKKARELAAAQK